VSITIQGIGVSKGIAIGKAHIIRHEPIEINEYCLPEYFIEEEIARFENALAIARQQLQRIRARISTDSVVDIATFIDTHLLMLDDSLLTRVPIDLIYEHQCNAEWALKLQCDNIVQIFDQMEDPYLSARKSDIEQVIARVQRILRGTAILARSLGIPAIVGLRHARSYIQPNDTVIVDGGVILVDPDERSLHYYQVRKSEVKRYRAALSKIKKSPSITRDGTHITLHVNIEFPEDMLAVKRVGSSGVGLYRTEFLFMNRQKPPDEEEHFEAYNQVIEALKGGPVTIRTLDLGADKQFVDSRFHDGLLATNPALGLRAIRLCLKKPQLFKPQLRAILRASALGQVRMMIPMVCGIQEVVQVRLLIDEIRTELRNKSIKFDPQMPYGIMLEVPAIALCTDLVAPLVDFLSLGTNDLIQYTLAIDRGDEVVNYLYDPLHPAVLRLIKMSIDAAKKAGKPISICGEMAGDCRYVRLLLGLGLRSFSVNPEAFLEVKQIIINSDIKSLAPLADKMLLATSHSEMANILLRINDC